MNIILLVGCSGAGKSTWATDYLSAHPDYVCINRDEFRLGLVKSLKGYYKRSDVNKLEGIVNTLTECTLLSAEQQGYNVLIDNTNLTQKYINNFINYSGAGQITWQFKLFDITPEIAKVRIIRRDFADDPILMTSDSFIESTMGNVAYIDRQHQQYQQIKKYLLENHINNQYEDV